MDTYGRIAGQMALATEQEARFEAFTAKTLPTSVPVELTTNSDERTASDSGQKPAKNSDSESAT